jgi:ParB-like chromosome segregation protein Spo0J
LAHQKLNRPTILATFTGQIDDMDALALSLSENLLRQDLNFLDTMNAVTALYIHYGRDERKVKAKLGLSIKSIRRFIRIQESGTDKIKKLLDEKKISPQDAKRVITAAQGDATKADALVDAIVGMSKPQKIRAVEFGENHPDASLEQITKFATTPKIEPTVIVNLPLKIQKALEAAVDQVQQDPEEIILGALKEWLITNDFLTE